jgi:exo-1,4-beta-D-glucosaminidase
LLAALALAGALGGGCGKAPPSPMGHGTDAGCPECTSVDASAPPPDSAVAAAPDLAACTTCGDGRIPLRDGWQLQSSTKITGTGADVSSVGYAAQGWYPASVPSTVLAALVADKVYPDPYVAENLNQIPATPFAGSWWYRTDFMLSPDLVGQSIWLAFDGINYRANVWLNGTQIASATDVIGTFRAFEWDVTALAHTGGNNALAVEVFAPDLTNDLTLTWLDWNPSPPDRNMGIWHDVYLRPSGPVTVRATHVSAQLDLPSLAAAHLTVKTDVHNPTAQAVHATVKLALEQLLVTEEVDLAAQEVKTVTFDPAHHPELDLANPRVWWPAQLGTQELYSLTMSAEVSGQVSDHESVRFGIRDIASEFTQEGYRIFRVNGKRILIRGGGWASDMMLRFSSSRLDSQLRYVRDLGLNTIRLEGKLESDDFYAALDQYGILALPGWMCCDRWQAWGSWSATDHQLAVASMETQARRLRNHPSVIAFLIGSDQAPPDNVVQELGAALTRNDWPNAIIASASNTTTSLGGSGFKMTGPYDWIAPAYWYSDTKAGGAFGFNTETGPGPAIPEIESLRVWLSAGELADLWSKPTAKHFHAGTGGLNFDNLSLFNQALAARYGTATSLEDYVKKAQLMNYEGERAEYEAYARNQYASATGVIHWMLNNAWPSLIWHLYPYDLTPAAGYFGAKKANQSLHIQYSLDDGSVFIVNHTAAAATGLQAHVRVYNLDATQQWANDSTLDVGQDAVAKVTTIPALGALSATYFVVLTLQQAGQNIDVNFYWQSSKAEIIDFSASDWYHAPTSQFADYTALGQLPSVALNVSATTQTNGGRSTTHVTLQNSSSSIAFFTRLKLTAGRAGAQVVPVLWTDNYISLMPGEKRDLSVDYQTSDLGGAHPAIEVDGWNVTALTVDG